MRVATVFDDPAVTAASGTSVYRTHTAQLWLTGRGFVRPGTRVAGGYACEGTAFAFDPPLETGEDVTVTVYNRTHALVRLREGKAWRKDPGPLKVASVTSGPMGPFPMFRPAVVAQVAPDAADDHKSGVKVTRTSHQLVYRAPNGAASTLTIAGAKLDKHAALVFAPPLMRGVDYTVVKEEAALLTLALEPGRAWRADPGPLVLKSLRVDGDDDPLHLATATASSSPTSSPTPRSR